MEDHAIVEKEFNIARKKLRAAFKEMAIEEPQPPLAAAFRTIASSTSETTEEAPLTRPAVSGIRELPLG